MIDWLTIELPPVGHDLNNGHVVFVRPNGEIDYMVEKFLTVQGSYDNSVQVRATGTEVVISGNPAKWLQGHNLFGISDFRRVLEMYVLSLRHVLKYDDAWYNDVMSGNFVVKRIDITYNYRLKNQGEVMTWLNAVSQVSSGKRQKLTADKGTTVYFGKNSKRSTVKFYDKEGELAVHPFSGKFDTEQTKFLEWYSKGLLRCELCIRRKALEDEFKLTKGIDYLKLTEKELRAIFMKKLKGVNIPDRMMVKDEIIEFMPHRIRAAYILWQQGHDMKVMWRRSQAYNIRKIMLEEYGVDIFLPCPSTVAKTLRVLPLLRPLEAIPEEIPVGAMEFGLLAA